MKTLFITLIALMFLTSVMPKDLPETQIRAFDRLDEYEMRENRNNADLSCSYMEYAEAVNELNNAIEK